MNEHAFHILRSGSFRCACLGLLILFVPMNMLRAQSTDSTRGAVEVSVEVGYHAMALTGMKQTIDGFTAFLQQAYNIDARTLLRFPGNALAGFSVSFRLSDPLRLELGADVTRSRGHVAYQDIYGSIDEDMRISAYFVSAGLQRDIFRTEELTTYLRARAGCLISKMTLSERFVFTELPEYNSSSSGSGSAYFITGELDAGIRTVLFGLNVSVEGGYRTNLRNRQYDFDDDFDGWVVGVRVGM